MIYRNRFPIMGRRFFVVLLFIFLHGMLCLITTCCFIKKISPSLDGAKGGMLLPLVIAYEVSEVLVQPFCGISKERGKELAMRT